MRVAVSEILCYNNPVPFLGSAQQNISPFCLLLKLAIQNRAVQMAGQCGHIIVAVILLYKVFSFRVL